MSSVIKAICELLPLERLRDVYAFTRISSDWNMHTASKRDALTGKKTANSQFADEGFLSSQTRYLAFTVNALD